MRRRLVSLCVLLTLAGCWSSPSGPVADAFADLPSGGQLLRVADGGAKAPTIGPGSEHCDTQDAIFLVLPDATEEPLGYIRDPSGSAPNFAADEFAADAAVPVDARFTGWTYGEVEFWTSPADSTRFVYVVHPSDRTHGERWPAVVGLCG